MFNLSDFIQDTSIFKQYQADGLIYAMYECPLRDAVFQYWTTHHYFLYVLRGKKRWTTTEDEYTAHAGDAIFCKKGVYTSHQFFDEPFDAIIIFAPDSLITSTIDDIHPRQPGKKLKPESPVMPVQLDEYLFNYFQSLRVFFGQQETPPQELLHLKFHELLHTLFVTGKNPLVCQYLNTVFHSTHASLRDIMEENYRYNLTLPEYARMTGRSLSKFKRDFRATYGETPGKWLVRKKLEWSRYRLESEDIAIGQLALECGFEDTSHFIKIFREQFGSTPFQHKKQFLS